MGQRHKWLETPIGKLESLQCLAAYSAPFRAEPFEKSGELNLNQGHIGEYETVGIESFTAGVEGQGKQAAPGSTGLPERQGRARKFSGMYP